MASEVMDWDSAYREEGDFEGPPPWNIGEPQPELAALITGGKVRSDVLDAGCGHRRTVAGAGGRRLHGGRHRPDPDRDRRGDEGGGGPRAVQRDFVQDDITSFTGFDEAVQHDRRQHAVPFAAGRGPRRLPAFGAPRRCSGGVILRPGVRERRVPAGHGQLTKPNEVTEDELRKAVSKYWIVDDIRPAFIHANAASDPRCFDAVPRFRREGPDQVPGLSADSAQGRLARLRRDRKRLGELFEITRRWHRRAAMPAAPAWSSRTAHAALRRKW